MTSKCFLEKELKTAEQKVEDIKQKLIEQREPTVVNIIEKEGVIIHDVKDYGMQLCITLDPNGHDFTTVTRPMYVKLGFVLQGFSIDEKDSVKTWWKKASLFDD